MGSTGPSIAGKLPKLSRKTSPRGKLMGSTRARSVAAAQSTSKKLPAREFNGQQSPAPRQSCPRASQKTSPRGSLMGSKVQHRGGAAQTKPENTTARKLLGSTRARSVPAAQSTSKKLPAREFIGQPSPAPRRSYPKYEQKTSREEV